MSTPKTEPETVHHDAPKAYDLSSEGEASVHSEEIAVEFAPTLPLQELPGDVLVEDDEDETPKIVDEELVGAETFEELNLAPALLEAIKTLGWTKPTLIQGLALPLTTQGQDLAGFSQTGTGKTGVFLITIAHQLLKLRETGGENSPHPKAMILAPTRELAVQISHDAEALFNLLNISSMAVFGGVDYEKQAQRIRSGVDVIVATPGRLKDYFQKKVFSTKDCSLFICDEADRMLDMGFIEDVEFFLSKLSPETQKLLFSATTNEQVKELAFEYLENPKYISVNPEVITPERIEQHAVICDSTEKLQVMLGLMRDHAPVCSIVFTNTKIVAEWLHYKLIGNGVEADLITGDLPQNKRIALIHRIKAGEVKALIATDVASRGLHIASISHVYNFDLPDEAANYVHRIGRTARAGAFGSAYSLICEDYGHNLLTIQQYLGENVPIKIERFPETYLQIEDKAGNPYKDQNFKGYSMREEDSSKSGRRQGQGQGQGRSGGRSGPQGPSDGPRTEGPRSEGRSDRKRPSEERSGSGRDRNQKAGKPETIAVKGKVKSAPKPMTGADQALDRNHGRNKHKKPSIQTGREGPARIIAPKKPEVVPNTLVGLFKKILAAIFPWRKK